MRKLLESKIGKVTDSEFKLIMSATTSDVLFNRVNFLKKTSKDEAMEIAKVIGIRIIA